MIILVSRGSACAMVMILWDRALIRSILDCVIIRSEAFEDASGLDESYHGRYENVDLCSTLVAMAWRIVCEPATIPMHHASKSGSERFNRWEANVERLETRWAGKLMRYLVGGADGEARAYPTGIHARAKSGLAAI